MQNKRPKRRRLKKGAKRFFSSILVLIILASVGFVAYKLVISSNFFNATFKQSEASKKLEIARELELPEWVDVQLIHKHTTARTGIGLIDIKNIVIHYVGNPNTTAQNNRDYFDKITTTVSSHFVVGLEGEIIQCVPLFERSAASNHRNKDTISIEVCHPDETGKFNPETYDAVVNISAYLCNKLSLDQNDIIRHYDITQKICPKYYVENEDEWEKLKKDIKVKLDEYKE